MSRKINRVGYKYGMLLVLSEGKTVKSITNNRHNTTVYWICQCDCGKLKEISGNDLRSGDTKSCGCQRYIMSSKGSRTHGLSKSLEYDIWVHIKQRCTNPENKAFHNYGKRQITMCDRWIESFENFYADMGRKPKGLSVERRDNDGNYEPSNCYWGTRSEQSRNRRDNIWLEHDGENMVLQDWANRFNVNATSLKRWLKKMTMVEIINKLKNYKIKKRKPSFRLTHESKTSTT